ncbi:MAG: ester cyclase [Candidatus Hermodarchaeia archaeon]|jgi:predicted ester cyclase
MSLEENKAIVRRWFEATNTQNLSIYDDLVAPDFVDHTRQVRGLENVKHFVSMVFKTFPDFHANIEDIIAEGDKVWVRVKITMTHTVEYRGIAPTGKKITETSVSINHIVDGKIVEQWYVTDDMDFYKQLGVIEYKGFPDEKVS